MIEVFPAIFKGLNSITPIMTKIVDGDLYILKRNAFIPLLSDYIHKAGHIHDRLKVYEERPLFDPFTGKKGDMMRIYPFGLDDYKEDFTQINQTAHIELESRRAECNYLARLVVNLVEIAKENGLQDLVWKRLKDDFDIIKQLNPQFVAVDKATKKKK